jgi:hypothetical protein
MTNKEKIYFLKETIHKLYTDEGRSKSYIARLLNLDRRLLTKAINDEWNLEKNKSKKHLNPSNQKFANKHREFIKSKLDKDFTVTDIAKLLNVKPDYIYGTIASGDEVIKNAIIENQNRMHKRAQDKKNKRIEQSSKQYIHIDENWKEIPNYKNYYVSNDGRICSFKETYNKYALLTPYLNSKIGRYYVKIKDKNLSVHRLVALCFVDGRTEEKNTVNHKDGNPLNNHHTNLEWVSQSENNKHAYDVLNRKKNKAHSRRKFKKLILNDKYEFKTIEALAKFLDLSWTQTSRYIDGEVANKKYKIDIIE